VTEAVPTGDEELPQEFRDSLDDDLGVSGALAVIHDTVRAGNTALDEGDVEVAEDAARLVIAMTDVLGVNPLDPAWGSGDSSTDDAMAALDVMVQERADAIRDQLAEAGIAVEDTASGARWTLVRGKADR
jgi:cysteinyl-tRNA synthetase